MQFVLVVVTVALTATQVLAQLQRNIPMPQVGGMSPETKTILQQSIKPEITKGLSFEPIGVTDTLRAQLSGQSDHTLDISELGSELGIDIDDDSGLSVDLYVVYEAYSPRMIVRRDPFETRSEFIERMKKTLGEMGLDLAKSFFLPKIAKLGGKVISGVNHYVELMLYLACSIDYNPKELTLELSGEIDALFADIGIGAAVMYDLQTACSDKSIGSFYLGKSG